MKRIVALALSTVIAGPALADGPTVAVVTPPVIAPPAPAADWTGAYAGLALGKGRVEVDAAAAVGSENVEVDVDSYGLFAGYNYDMGRAVIGGEFSYDRVGVDEDDDDSDDATVMRLMARAGYDAGTFMPYVTAGFAQLSNAEGEADVTENGYAYGVGVDALLGNNFVVGAQYLQHKFDVEVEEDGLTAEADFTVNLFQIRAAYKF